MTDVWKQLSQMFSFSAACQALLWKVGDHLWNNLLFFQWWLRGWCLEEWHIRLKTPVNMCLRSVQFKHTCRYLPTCSVTAQLTNFLTSSHHNFSLSCHLFSFLLDFVTFCSILTFHLSALLCSSRWAGQMVLCYLLSELSRRWWSCCPRWGSLKHIFLDKIISGDKWKVSVLFTAQTDRFMFQV